MPERGVKAPAAEAVMAPSDRVIGSHRAACVAGLIHGEEHMDVRSGIRAERIPLVASGPGHVEVPGGRVVPVLDGDRAVLHWRVLVEPRACQVAEPGPVVLSGGRGVDPQPGAPGRDISGDRLAAGLIEDVAACGQEDDRRVPAYLGRAEYGGVLG